MKNQWSELGRQQGLKDAKNISYQEFLEIKEFWNKLDETENESDDEEDDIYDPLKVFNPLEEPYKSDVPNVLTAFVERLAEDENIPNGAPHQSFFDGWIHAILDYFGKVENPKNNPLKEFNS
jgi:hypothetical protein